MREDFEFSDAELDEVAGGFSFDGIGTAASGAVNSVSDAMNSVSDAMNNTMAATKSLLDAMTKQAGSMSNVVDGIGQGEVGGYV